MESAASRSLRTAATLTAVGALALAPVTIAPPTVRTPDMSAARISSQAVRPTDAWSDLFDHTRVNLAWLGTAFVGVNIDFPLPSPTIFVVPIVTQLVLNPLIYTVQLFTGQAATIPAEIAGHLANLEIIAKNVGGDLPWIIDGQIRLPLRAVQLTIDYVVNATNKLVALLEAPAVFLDIALNDQYGLLGQSGPVAVPVLVRNLIASALDTPLPTIPLPFKKPAAAVTPKTPAAATVAAPAATASARSKPKAPSSADSKRKPAAKASSKGTGVGHGKRD